MEVKIQKLEVKNLAMSVEEMKKEAVKKINQLQSEKAVKEILNHLEKVGVINNETNADDVFAEAQRKYDSLLKRLA